MNRYIHRPSLKEQKMTAADILNEIQQKYGVIIGVSTIRKHLKEFGLLGRVFHKKGIHFFNSNALLQTLFKHIDLFRVQQIG